MLIMAIVGIFLAGLLCSCSLFVLMMIFMISTTVKTMETMDLNFDFGTVYSAQTKFLESIKESRDSK
jgi:hypothetical protein